MRATLCLIFLLSACAGKETSGDPTATKDDGGQGSVAPTNPPVAPDAGPPAADTTPDAGPSPVDTTPDAGNPADAGPVPTLETIDCPGPPRLLWSRTFDGDVDFGGVDGDGNVYWLEFDPPRSTQTPRPPALLTSADRNGLERYRVQASVAGGTFGYVAGEIVTSQGAVLGGYDAATGALSWTLDLSGLRVNGPNGLTDRGNGSIAFVMNDDQRAIVYFVDAKTGSILHSFETTADKELQILGSDGAGSVLAAANPTESSTTDSFTQEADVFLLDPSGLESWREHIVNGPPSPGRLLAWPAGLPWLSIKGQNGIVSNGNHWTVSTDLFAASFGDQIGIGFDSVTFVPGVSRNTMPLGIDVLRDHRVVARALLSEIDTIEGAFVMPLALGDHVDFVAQSFHDRPALCHPVAAGNVIFGRADARNAYACPLTFSGENFMGSSAISKGHLIISRTTLTSDACGPSQVNPLTIEAYSLADEPQ